jgi:hypothetical protein
MPTPNPASHPKEPSNPPPAPDEAATGSKADDQNSLGAPVAVQIGFAIGLTALFIVLVVIMLASAHDADTVWQKKVYIYGSVEAVVFTAIGWVFGRQVQRGQVAAAEANAADAKKEAKDSAAKAEEAQQQTQIVQAESAERQAHVAELATAVRIVALAPVAGPPVPPDAQPGVARDVGFGDDEPRTAQTALSPQLAALRSLADRLHPPDAGF